MHLLSPFVVASIIFLGSFGCAPQPVQSGDLQIWVSIQPLKTFVEAVVGDHARISVMVPSGQSPETYSPSVPQMAALARADLYFGIGMPLERRILERIERSMPQLRFIQTADIVEHAHGNDDSLDDSGEDGSCALGDEDPHVWMDPIWVVGLVEQVEVALSAARPELSEQFAANAAAFKLELRALDTALSAQLAPYAGRAFYINHPSLGHFARRYALKQRSIEQGGSAPSARQVAELIESARAERVGAVFSQLEFGRSSADLLAKALKVKVISLDVLSGDYFGNMQEIGNQLEASFRE